MKFCGLYPKKDTLGEMYLYTLLNYVIIRTPDDVRHMLTKRVA